MTQPEQRTVTVGTFSVSRLLMFIAAVCMLLAAVTECGASLGGAPAWAWAFGGLSAWALASVF
jgi:hypothetical protein